MILINKQIFAIEPTNGPVTQFMRELDESHVELITHDFLNGQFGEWGMSIRTAEWSYRGIAVWVCPD